MFLLAIQVHPLEPESIGLTLSNDGAISHPKAPPHFLETPIVYRPSLSETGEYRMRSPRNSVLSSKIPLTKIRSDATPLPAGPQQDGADPPPTISTSFWSVEDLH